MYYVDTCIWLNILKREMPFWEVGYAFIKQKQGQISITAAVLVELKSKLKDVDAAKILFKKENVRMIDTVPDDFVQAGALDSRFGLGFYDCLHIIVAKRLGCTLVTRDRKLIYAGRKFVTVKRPEELIP